MSAVAILSQLDRPGAVVGRIRSANWQTWSGHAPRPMAAHVAVAVLLRNGLVLKGLAAAFCWEWDVAPDGSDPEDIVAFRKR